MSLTLRARPSYRMFAAVASSALGAMATIAAIQLVFAASPDDRIDGLIGAVGFGCFFLLSLLLVIWTRRHRLTLDDRRIAIVGLIRSESMALPDVCLVEWPTSPKDHRVLFADGRKRLRIDVSNYRPRDLATLINRLRASIPTTAMQHGWEDFAAQQPDNAVASRIANVSLLRLSWTVTLQPSAARAQGSRWGVARQRWVCRLR